MGLYDKFKTITVHSQTGVSVTVNSISIQCTEPETEKTMKKILK